MEFHLKREQGRVGRLMDLSSIISSMMALDENEKIFEYIAHKVAALLHAENCTLFWVDHTKNTIDLKASHITSHALFERTVVPISSQPGAGLLAYVAATGEPLYFVDEDYKKHPSWNNDFSDDSTHLPSRQCYSLIIYPITDQRRNILGVIKVENKLGVGRHEGFTSVDQELLGLLVVQVASSINMLHLHQTAKTITQTVGLRALLPRIARSAVELLLGDLVVVSLYDVDKGELLVDESASYGQREDSYLTAKLHESGVTQRALQSRNGYLVIEDLDREPEAQAEVTRREGVQSFMVIVLRARNIPVGILYCNFRQPRCFSPEEIRYAQAFGELAAVAIHNAKLFASQAQIVNLSSSVQKLVQASMANQRLDTILELVCEAIRDILGFELCTVSLVNRAENIIETRVGKGVPEEWIKLARHSLDSTDIQSVIIRTGKTELIEGWDDRFDKGIYDRFGHAQLVRVFAPIRGRERILGTVEAGCNRSHKSAITQRVLSELKVYLEHVALIIESARLLDRESQRVAVLKARREMILRIGQGVSQEDISDVLKLAADMAVMISRPGASAAIYYCDGDQPDDKLLFQTSSGADEALLQRHSAFTHKEHLQMITATKPVVRAERYSPDDHMSSVCIPLKTGVETLGSLCVVYDREYRFTPDELDGFELCAAPAAVAISLVRGHQRLTRRLDGLSDEIGRSYHSGIGQPLTIANDILENLLDEREILGPLNLTPLQTDRLRTVKHELDALKTQIHRLLLVRRLEDDSFKLTKKKVAINVLVQDAVNKVQDMLREKRITMICEIKELTCALEVDEERIKQTLVDLLINAIKFTPTAGKIEVRGEKREREICLLISDSGRGIAPEHWEKVFEKYCQIPPLLSNEDKGAGLGLYMARKLVRFHSGDIVVESQLGQGSIFTVTLPRQ